MNIIFNKIKDLIPFKSCIKERENGNLLIVAGQNGEILYLNEVSKDFYKLCDGSKSISQICTEMLDIYDVEPNELETDLLTLIRDMQWKDILRLKETE